MGGKTSPDATSFGRQLRRFRECAGLTQEELAERAGLSAYGVSALERGARVRPHPHTARALIAALGLSPGEREAFMAAAVAPRGPRSAGISPAPPESLPEQLTPSSGASARRPPSPTCCGGRTSAC